MESAFFIQLLAIVALSCSSYNALSHFSSFIRKMQPPQQRTRAGFGLALFFDVATYTFVVLYVALSAGPAPWYWPFFLLGLVTHLAYSVLFSSDFWYRRMHNYKRETIFSDGKFVGLKTFMLGSDTLFHALAVFYLFTQISLMLPLALGSIAFILIWIRPASEETKARRVAMSK
ncbi:MAG TPA: hypothetical protein VJA18_05360 [Candidatus Nanoarchaeia archaeon]|nr:hypothetical protein [Candidatus Nanoarchaeia archaeon]